MSLIEYTTQQDASQTRVVPLVSDENNEQLARQFFARLELREITQAAIVDYNQRVVEGRPYEDAVSVDDLARMLGR